MKQFKLILLTLLILMPFVSATGLQIISHENLNIEKSNGIDKEIQLIVYNGLDKDFHNLGFEEDWVESEPFNLSYQENKTINIKITRDEDFSGEITLRGDYEQDIGQSNQTTEVKINDNTGITPCNIEIIEGDSIKWINEYDGEITLIEEESQTDFQTILEGDNYTKKFNTPMEFIYYAEIFVSYSSLCKITVQDDSGLIHSSQYDFKLPTEIKINYEPTTLELTALETNYSIEYNQEKEDILKLKNTGQNIGKNIKLEAQWFEFSENNFDLQPGESKNIEYTISPEVYKTNETDKTHNINLKITGNFEEINKQFNIFIPYRDLDYIFSDDGANKEFINEFFKYYCENNPDQEICIRQQTNQSGGSQNIEITKETIKKLAEIIQKMAEEDKTYKKNDLEFKQEINQTLTNLSKSDEKQSEETKQVKEELENLSKSINALIIIFLSVLAGVGLFGLWKNKGKFDLIRKRLGYQKGELKYG